MKDNQMFNNSVLNSEQRELVKRIAALDVRILEALCSGKAVKEARRHGFFKDVNERELIVEIESEVRRQNNDATEAFNEIFPLIQAAFPEMPNILNKELNKLIIESLMVEYEKIKEYEIIKKLRVIIQDPFLEDDFDIDSPKLQSLLNIAPPKAKTPGRRILVPRREVKKHLSSEVEQAVIYYNENFKKTYYIKFNNNFYIFFMGALRDYHYLPPDEILNEYKLRKTFYVKGTAGEAIDIRALQKAAETVLAEEVKTEETKKPKKESPAKIQLHLSSTPKSNESKPILPPKIVETDRNQVKPVKQGIYYLVENNPDAVINVVREFGYKKFEKNENSLNLLKEDRQKIEIQKDGSMRAPSSSLTNEVEQLADSISKDMLAMLAIYVEMVSKHGIEAAFPSGHVNLFIALDVKSESIQDDSKLSLSPDEQQKVKEVNVKIEQFLKNVLSEKKYVGIKDRFLYNDKSLNFAKESQAETEKNSPPSFQSSRTR